MQLIARTDQSWQKPRAGCDPGGDPRRKPESVSIDDMNIGRN
jgi:hypothetical protein